MTAAVSSYSDKLNKALYQKGMVSPDEFTQLCNEHYSYVLFLKVGDMFKILEENSGVQRLYIAYGIIGLTISWLAFGFGGQLVANGIGSDSSFIHSLFEFILSVLPTQPTAQSRHWSPSKKGMIPSG